MIIIKLRELLWQKNVKGYEVANATNITPATISKMVKGRGVDVKLSTIDKLCTYFKCELNDIIEYVQD